MIRASLTVVPSRLPVLWGKLKPVFCRRRLRPHARPASHHPFLVGPGTARAGSHLQAAHCPEPGGAACGHRGAALYPTVAGMTAAALACEPRNTAAAITTFVAVFFVIPPLTNLLPTSFTDHFVQYPPSNAAGAVLLDGTYGVANPLTPWPGFVVMYSYAVVPTACRPATPPSRRLIFDVRPPWIG